MQAILFLAICMAQAVAVTLFVRRRWPSLVRWKRVVAAAAPFPAVVLLLCAFIYLRAAATPAERCGGDGCSRAMMAAFAISLLAAVGGLLAALIALVMTRRPRA